MRNLHNEFDFLVRMNKDVGHELFLRKEPFPISSHYLQNDTLLYLNLTSRWFHDDPKKSFPIHPIKADKQTNTQSNTENAQYQKKAIPSQKKRREVESKSRVPVQ